MNCPIGLECIADRCPNDHYCSNLAAAWPLPYQIWGIDYYYDPGALVVSIPDLTNWEEVPNYDYAIDQADNYDNWMRYIHRELREVGWQNPVDLPYFWDEVTQCLFITHSLIVERKDGDPFGTGFSPPVPLGDWRANFWKGVNIPKRDEYDFYVPQYSGLAWRWTLDEDD